MLVLVQGSLLECVFTIVGFITTACIVFLCKSKKKSKRRSAAGMVRLLPGQFHEESKYEYSTQPQDPMITALQFEDEKKPPPVPVETGKTELNVDATEAGGETGFATAFGPDAVNKDVQRSEVKSSATNVQKTEKSAVIKSLNKSKLDQSKSGRSKPKQDQRNDSLISGDIDDRLKSRQELKSQVKNDSLRTEQTDYRLKSNMQ